MAQNGNSCSNPYVMNLTNGAGNGEFQFHYPDTVMYIKLIGLQDKQTIILDSINNLELNKISCFENGCNGNYCYDRPIYTELTNRIDLHLNFKLLDTVLLALFKENNYTLCNNCDSLKISILIMPTIQATQACTTSECNNLIENGGFEGFDEAYFVSGFSNQQYTLNRICAWDQDYVLYSPLGLNTPDYFNFWFDDQGPQYIANSVLNYPGTNCIILPQLENPFFIDNFNGIQIPPSQQYPANSAYAGLSIKGPYSEILKGELSSTLIPSKRYYLETNIIKRNDGWEGGVINIDLTNAANYTLAAYGNGSNFDMSIIGFNYSPNWQKFNTIFTAVGNEEYIYVGNLAQNPLAPVASIGTPSCPNTNPSLYYYFDNFVVKEFFADAGAPTIACEGAPVLIGGNSCQFPNAVYNWQPAAYFVNNTNILQNPTFLLPLGSGFSNVTCTLTVTIPMADGSFAITDPSYVNITIIQGTSITLGGTTTVLPNGIANLNANGGSNYVWTGSDGTSFTGASITTGQLTQDVTYTVTALSISGCSVTETITVTVTPLPAACVSDPNYPNTIIIPDGTDFNGFLFILGLTSGLPNYNFINTNFALEGTFTIDLNTPISFTSCHFYCNDEASFYNQSGDVVLRNCTLEACNNVLWKGINNEGKLAMSYCLVKDARDGILIAPQTKNFITGNTFRDNYIGINIFGDCIFSNQNNKFSNPNPLLPHWLGWNLPRAQCGILVTDATLIEIDNIINPAFTTFTNLNTGILCFNSDLVVNNAYFENIHDQFNVGNDQDGCGIYAQGTSANTLEVFPLHGISQNITFDDCDNGIFYDGCNARLSNLGIKNVERGIVGELMQFCTNIMEYNYIESTNYGIELNIIDDVHLMVVNHNDIISVSEDARGISATAFSNQSSINSNIKIQANNVDITNGVYGIEINNIFHPKVNVNTIYHSQLVNVGTINYWNGIRATGCERADVSCNTTMVGSSLANFNSGADIYVSESNSTLLACNYTLGESPTGIFLSSENQGSSIQTNEIGSHNIGMYLDNSCVMGPQPGMPNDAPHANKWNGSYSNQQYNGAAAVNENIFISGIVNQAIIENNQFFVHTSQVGNSIYNPSNFPDNIHGTNWFTQSSIIPLESCAGGYCLNLENDIDGEENSLRMAIAQNLITTVGYPEQTKWMLRYGLIRELNQNDSLLNNNDTLQDFYFNVAQFNLRQFTQVNDSVAAIALYNQTTIDAMHANDSILKLYRTAVNDLFLLALDSSITDSINVLISGLLNQYQTIAVANNIMHNNLKALKQAAVSYGETTNSAIIFNNFNEYLEQQVNDIFLRNYANNFDSLSVQDINFLAGIINICPQAGGPAIYKARALYQLFNDTLSFNDSIVCRQVGYFRESENKLMPYVNQIEQTLSFNIYPNPATDKLNIVLDGNLQEGIFHIYNAQGVLIEVVKIAKDNHQKEIDLSNYADGLYVINYMTSNSNLKKSFIKLK